MTPSQQRARLREDRRRLERDARELREVLKARVDRQLRDPAFAPLLARRARARRRKILTTLVAALLLLLLLLIDCDPEPVGAPVVDEGPLVPEPAVAIVAPKERKKKRARAALAGKIDSTARPDLEVEAVAAPAWLSDFRLQVAARSPRLSACFNGAEEPGAMRWTTVVHARSGRVSDSELEAVFRGASVGGTQEACLTKVLSTPAYRLKDVDDEAVARRVSIIFEF